MQTFYQSSRVFGDLKAIREQIPDNLSSSNYLKTLDALIHNGLIVVFDTTKYAEMFASKMLAWQTIATRRKISAKDKSLLPQNIVKFLLASTPKEKIRMWNNIGFNRSINFELLRSFIECLSHEVDRKQFDSCSIPTETYEKVFYAPTTAVTIAKIHAYETMVSKRDDKYLMPAYHQIKHWYELANKFKEVILEKYTRLCITQAQRDYVSLSHSIPLDDLVQTYMLLALKAIDRSDSNKGVLTTQIQTWLRSAKSIAVESYLHVSKSKDQIIVVIPESQLFSQTDSEEDGEEGAKSNIMELAAMYEHNDVCEDSIATKTSQTETLNRVRWLAKRADPKGYARLLLGIEEIF